MPQLKEIMQKAKRWDKKDEYRQNPDGSKSTHKMAWGSMDGKYVAFPTVYPKKREGTKSHNPKDWVETKGNESIDSAIARKELYTFKKKEDAKKWAEGGYKKN